MGSKSVEEGETELNIIVRPYWRYFQEVLEEVVEDGELQKIVEDITKNPDMHPAFTLENGRLHYKGRLVLSAKSKWIPKILAVLPLGDIRGYTAPTEQWPNPCIG